MKQPARHVWFIKRGDQVTGPFPSKLVLKWRILGRVHGDTLVSIDQTEWQRADDVDEVNPIKQYGDPKDPLVRERLAAVIRWEDERGGHDVAAVLDRFIGERVGDERRRDERLESRVARGIRTARQAEDTRARDRQEVRDERRIKRQTWLFATMMLVAGAAALQWLPRMSFDAPPDCAAAPRPGVNWNYCRLDGATLRQAQLSGAQLQNASLGRADLQRADLSGASLSFANLALAQLTGANLRNANLTGVSLRGASIANADFTQADLSYVDFSLVRLDGAVLSGAKLGKAIWTDGRVCAPDSIGVCK